MLCGASRPPKSDSYGGGGFVVDLTEAATSLVDLTFNAEAPVSFKRKRKRKSHHRTRVTTILTLSKFNAIHLVDTIGNFPHRTLS